jgi:multidrug efflux pump subunit AcrA (membrane-fusion protein)
LRDGFNSVFILKKNTPHSTSNNNNNNTNDTTNNNTDTNNTLNNTTIHNQENINKVSQVKIVTGQREKNSIEVISGLSPTDQIVATGAAFLSDGDTVKVITP